MLGSCLGPWLGSTINLSGGENIRKMNTASKWSLRNQYSSSRHVGSLPACSLLDHPVSSRLVGFHSQQPWAYFRHLHSPLALVCPNKNTQQLKVLHEDVLISHPLGLYHLLHNQPLTAKEKVQEVSPNLWILQIWTGPRKIQGGVNTEDPKY